MSTGYDRDYDREYEGDYDTEGQDKDELVRSARGVDKAFAASMPSAVQVQNSIAMGDVNGSSGDSYFASLKGAWQQNRRRMIIVSSIAVVLAILAITLATTIDLKPAPAASKAPAASTQVSTPPAESTQPMDGTTTTNTTADPYNNFSKKQCMGQTLTYNKHLLPTQFLCSLKNNYAFGLNDNGDLVWGNDDSNFYHKIFKAQPEYASADRFIIGQHGRFEITDEIGQVYWSLPSIFGNSIKPMENNPINNKTVPYLSMHNDGVLVLVYYNHTTDELEEHNIQKIYPKINGG
jgi:hypothetical protein